MREPEVRFVEVDGLSLAVHEWAGDGTAEGGTAEGGPVVLVHATGLCGRVWDPVVASLPEGLRVLAVDIRGHGLSDCPPIEERFHWRGFGEDVAAVLEQLDLRDATLVGHSMGGHAATAAALEVPERVARLVLLDPTLTALPSEQEPLRPPASEQPSRKRRNEWASPEAFFDNLRGKPVMSTWDERALRAYTVHGLRQVEGGGYVLACPPLFEASIYAGNQSACLDDDLPRITAHVSVVRARPRTPEDPPGLGPTATRMEAVARFRNVTDRQLPAASHFFPLEEPEVAADAIIEALDR